MAVTAASRGARTRWRPTLLAWGLWTLTILGLVVLIWLDQLLRQTGRPELVVLNPTAFAPVLGAVSTATVGAVVASRRPGGQVRARHHRDGDGLQRLRAAGHPDRAVAVARLALVGGLNPPILSAGIGAAILRYRLYDLDRIISRTLAYGLLTLLLSGGYAVVVLGLSQLLGRDSPLVVAAATLAVAALFQPARRRIQRLMDRRFNRRGHDADQTITTFSARLRDQVDLTTLTGELLTVVDQTMQPTRASLWLRPQGAATTTDATAAHHGLGPVQYGRN
jgi:hypothetical protein